MSPSDMVRVHNSNIDVFIAGSHLTIGLDLILLLSHEELSEAIILINGLINVLYLFVESIY